MKKRVLFVINSLACGGAEKSLVSLLSLFDFSKYQVDLQMFNRTGMFLPLVPEEVNILPELPYSVFLKNHKGSLHFWMTRIKTSLGLRFPSKINGKHLHDAQRYWKYAQSAFSPLDTSYDIAVAWGQGNPTHFVVQKVTAKKKIAFINVDYELAGHNKWFDYPYYKRFDHIVTVSDPLQRIMEKVYPDLRHKLTTIYDIRNQTLIKKMAAKFDPYSPTDNVPILVTVGRMVALKGYDLAVEACKILKDRGYSFKWYLVGDGPERSRILSLISEKKLDNCIFSVGAKENPYPYIKHADIYVQTSRFEGFCLTLCEARILCTPPVSTNFEVVYDQLQDGKNGLIVNMTPPAIADGIEKLLSDTALRQSISITLSCEKNGNEEEISKLYSLIEGII